jgi:hypothetical protein
MQNTRHEGTNTVTVEVRFSGNRLRPGCARREWAIVHLTFSALALALASPETSWVLPAVALDQTWQGTFGGPLNPKQAAFGDVSDAMHCRIELLAASSR